VSNNFIIVTRCETVSEPVMFVTVYQYILFMFINVLVKALRLNLLKLRV